MDSVPICVCHVQAPAEYGDAVADHGLFDVSLSRGGWWELPQAGPACTRLQSSLSLWDPGPPPVNLDFPLETTDGEALSSDGEQEGTSQAQGAAHPCQAPGDVSKLILDNQDKWRC